MTINPGALLPTNRAGVAASRNKQPVTADLDEPAHVEPLHSIVKVQLNHFLLQSQHVLF